MTHTVTYKHGAKENVSQSIAGAVHRDANVLTGAS